MTWILSIFSLDSHTDTVNTPAWLSSNPVSRIAHAIATPQHHYTRIQHVNICTLSDKPCVMLSLYMSTFFFMILFCISILLWYRVHCTNNTVSYGLDFGPENESVCCSRNQVELGSYYMVYIGSSNMINPGARTTGPSTARKSIMIIHAFHPNAFVDTCFKPLPSEYLFCHTSVRPRQTRTLLTNLDNGSPMYPKHRSLKVTRLKILIDALLGSVPSWSCT